MSANRYTKLNQSNIDSFRTQMAIKENGQWHQPLITDSVFLESASTLIHTSGPRHMIPRGKRFMQYRDANSFSYNPSSTRTNVSAEATARLMAEYSSRVFSILWMIDSEINGRAASWINTQSGPWGFRAFNPSKTDQGSSR